MRYLLSFEKKKNEPDAPAPSPALNMLLMFDSMLRESMMLEGWMSSSSMIWANFFSSNEIICEEMLISSGFLMFAMFS